MNAQFVALSTPFLLLAATGCSSGSSSSAPKARSVAFTSENGTANESDASTVMTIEMSRDSDVDVSITLQLGGTATDVDDYTLDIASVVIPAGELSVELTLTPAVDALCEEDETVEVTIIEADGADVGDANVHTVTLVNAPLDEAEPNNIPAQANPIAMIEPELACDVAGDIAAIGGADNFDYFRLESADTTLVSFELTPDDAGTDVVLWVTGEGGNVLQMIDDGGAGAAETGQHTTSAGFPVFLLAVLSNAGSGGYTLNVSGAAALAGTGGPDAPLVRAQKLRLTTAPRVGSNQAILELELSN